MPEKYWPALRKLNHSIGTGKDRVRSSTGGVWLRDIIDHASPAVHTWLAESRRPFKGERGRIENSLTVDGRSSRSSTTTPARAGRAAASQLPRFIETMKIANEQRAIQPPADHMLGEHGGHGGASASSR